MRGICQKSLWFGLTIGLTPLLLLQFGLTIGLTSLLLCSSPPPSAVLSSVYSALHCLLPMLIFALKFELLLPIFSPISDRSPSFCFGCEFFGCGNRSGRVSISSANKSKGTAKRNKMTKRNKWRCILDEILSKISLIFSPFILQRSLSEWVTFVSQFCPPFDFHQLRSVFIPLSQPKFFASQDKVNSIVACAPTLLSQWNFRWKFFLWSPLTW